MKNEAQNKNQTTKKTTVNRSPYEIIMAINIPPKSRAEQRAEEEKRRAEEARIKAEAEAKAREIFDEAWTTNLTNKLQKAVEEALGRST